MSKHHHKIKHEARAAFGKMRSKGSLTQEKARSNLDRIATFCADRGLQHISHLNTKTVTAFVESLKTEGLKASTIEGYLTTLRQLANNLGKNNIVHRENVSYGITRRGEDRYAPKTEVNHGKLAEVKEKLYQKAEWLGIAQTLREAFGLRMKESLLSGKVFSDERGNHYMKIEKATNGGKERVVTVEGARTLEVKGAKGGRPRDLVEQTKQQIAAINELRAYQEKTGRTSIIPPDLTLKQAYDIQRNTCHRLGMTKANNANPHISRHAEAQRMASEGASKREIVERLGHSDERKISHYVPKS